MSIKLILLVLILSNILRLKLNNGDLMLNDSNLAYLRYQYF
jgi:hypothetical protein